MNQPKPEQEPSMEEILASIRRIISEDGDEADPAGASLRAFIGATEVTDATVVYFDEAGLPSTDLARTTSQARWAMVNAPAGAPLRVELWGRLQGGDETLLGCEELEAYADTLSTTGIGPLRADGPPGCGD